MKALVIVNPNSGKKGRGISASEICAAFGERGVECRAYATKASGDAERITRKLAGHCDLLICSGGDGTLSEIVNGLYGLKGTPPIIYFPTGTTNDFARSMGLSFDPKQALNDALTGRKTQLDVGRMNGRCFIYSAVFGAFVKSSYSTPRQMKEYLGKLAYYIECVRELPAIKPCHMRIVDDAGHVREGDYLFGAISNATSIGAFLHYPSALVDFADGRHEVLLIRHPEDPVEFICTLRSVISGDLSANGIELFHTSKLYIECDRVPDWSLDGEQFDSGSQIAVENLPAAVTFVLPPK